MGRAVILSALRRPATCEARTRRSRRRRAMKNPVVPQAGGKREQAAAVRGVRRARDTRRRGRRGPSRRRAEQRLDDSERLGARHRADRVGEARRRADAAGGGGEEPPLGGGEAGDVLGRRRRQRRSGREPSVPRPLQGASSEHARRTPRRTTSGRLARVGREHLDAPRPRRARLARSAAARASSTSTAVTRAPGCARRELRASWCPARRTGRARARPGRAAPAATRPASCEPRDCAVTRPSRKGAERLQRRAVVEERLRQAGHRLAVKPAAASAATARRRVAAQRVDAQAALGRAVGGGEQRSAASRRRDPPRAA